MQYVVSLFPIWITTFIEDCIRCYVDNVPQHSIMVIPLWIYFLQQSLDIEIVLHAYREISLVISMRCLLWMLEVEIRSIIDYADAIGQCQSYIAYCGIFAHLEIM